MPRTTNLKRELEIRRLRGEGKGVREIAAALNASPSTVSRILRRDPNRSTLATQDERLSLVEKKLEVVTEALVLVTNLFFEYHGGRAKQRMLEVLADRWPEPYFKSAFYAGRL